MERAIVLHPVDNVATVLADLSAGEVLELAGHPAVALVESIPFGYKVALVHIPVGGQITKYGYSIGRATAAIPAGACVHVHNVESLRGRGDRAG